MSTKGLKWPDRSLPLYRCTLKEKRKILSHATTLLFSTAAPFMLSPDGRKEMLWPPKGR
jgi:hypothetical protein